MHGTVKISFGLLSAVLFLTSCAVPPSRLGDYVSSERRAGEDALTQIERRPLKAGLVLVSDTTQPDAAPNLPDEAFVRLGETLRLDISRAIPVMITDVLSADQIRPQPIVDCRQFADLGRKRGLDYLAVVCSPALKRSIPSLYFSDGRRIHSLAFAVTIIRSWNSPCWI